MSVSIATLGIFSGARGTRAVGGSTLVREKELIKPLVLVKNVEYEKNRITNQDLVIVKTVKTNVNGDQ